MEPIAPRVPDPSLYCQPLPHLGRALPAIPTATSKGHVLLTTPTAPQTQPSSPDVVCSLAPGPGIRGHHQVPSQRCVPGTFNEHLGLHPTDHRLFTPKVYHLPIYRKATIKVTPPDNRCAAPLGSRHDIEAPPPFPAMPSELPPHPIHGPRSK